jgi:hypothetical protein
MNIDPSTISTLSNLKSKEELFTALKDCKRSELISLYQPENNTFILEHLETLLEEHPKDDIIRLLWSRSQIELDIMPLSFIASSLFEILQKNEVLDHAGRLAFLVAAPLTIKLGENEEYRIGLLLLSKLLTCNPSSSIKESVEENALLNIAQVFIEQEKIRAIQRREQKSYFDFIDATARDLEIRKKSTPNASSIPNMNAPISPLPQISSTIELHENFTLSEPSNEYYNTIADSKHSTLNKTYTLIEKPIDSVSSPNKNRLAYNKKLFSPATISFLVLLLLLFIFFNPLKLQFDRILSSFKKPPIEDRLVSFLNSAKDNKPLLSYLPPFHSLSVHTSSTLEDINERLNNLNSRHDPSKDSSSNTPIDYDEIESLDLIPDKGAGITPAKPIPVFGGGGSSIPSRPPSTKPPEDLGSTDKKQEISPNRQPIRTGPDGRAYGSIQMNDPLQGRDSEKALDGSPLRSYEVEKFDPPLVFETITGTNVLSAPSLLSPSITRLDAHTHIQVTARMGFWLEILSNHGRIGYIYAQDATELSPIR